MDGTKSEADERFEAAARAVAKRKTRHTRSGDAIMIDPDMLVGIREITERLIALGVAKYSRDEMDRARSAITTLISRRDETFNEKGNRRSANHFPLPLVQLKATGLYDWAEVEEWLLAFYQ